MFVVKLQLIRNILKNTILSSSTIKHDLDGLYKVTADVYMHLQLSNKLFISNFIVCLQ